MHNYENADLDHFAIRLKMATDSNICGLHILLIVTGMTMCVWKCYSEHSANNALAFLLTTLTVISSTVSASNVASSSLAMLSSHTERANDRMMLVLLEEISHREDKSVSVLTSFMTSNSSGYITTGTCNYYSNRCDQNTTIRVTVPDDHVILVSFPVFDLRWPWYSEHKGFVELLTTEKSGNVTPIWRFSSFETIPPDLYSTSILIRLVIPLQSNLIRGFKMVFTVHPVAQTPPKVSEGVFNCSVSFYETFKEHFHCNQKAECSGGEDEGEQCSLSGSLCHGGMAVGSKCYFTIRKSQALTWQKARRECEKLGGDLATIRSHGEWTAFAQIRKAGSVVSEAYVGMQSFHSSLPNIYRKLYVWVDGVVNYHLSTRTLRSSSFFEEICFSQSGVGTYFQILFYIACDNAHLKTFICETQGRVAASNSSVAFPEVNDTSILQLARPPLVTCTGGHVTHKFMLCDPRSHCGTDRYISQCDVFDSDAARGADVMMFTCDDAKTTVPYTLVCDFRKDCEDASDEVFCVHTNECWGFRCRSGQCVHSSTRCDLAEDCWDGSDELCTHYFNRYGTTNRMFPPALIDFDSYGGFTQTELEEDDPCPQTHFRCPEGYCLPLYCRCNGVSDCWGKEDEAGCEGYQCPGFYRCLSSSVCVHADHLCDGWPQCPQRDDEWLCDDGCPPGCACQGHATVCSHPFNVTSFPDLRYLDAAGSGMTLDDVTGHAYLVWLSLARCGLHQVTEMDLPNLRTLDLSQNRISLLHMDVFLVLKNVRVLRLSKNPIVSMVSEATDVMQSNLVAVDLSGTAMKRFNSSVLSNYPRVRILNMTNSALTSISTDGFKHMPSLRHIDLRGNKVHDFPRDVFHTLTRLQTIYADNYKLCCKDLLPPRFDKKKCYAPMDEVSSCEDLLRSNTYRTFLWLFSVLSVVGNMGCLLTRVVLLKSKSLTSFSIFVANLSIADLIMGVYLAMVGAADHIYRGQYFVYEKTWKSSISCKIGGFLSFLSSETSAFFICLITLDRFLVLSSPFGEVHFKRRSAGAVCSLAWTLGLFLAAVPLLPMTSDWDFYSQTGICIPLPVTRSSFKGRHYAFGIMIIFNLVLFVLIATGQAMIYWTIRTTSMAKASTRKTKDLAIARRLVSVVLSDFLCWFPIGLLGMMAASGIPIPGEVNVGMATFVLPFNAALNPFLYTFKTLSERWRKLEEERLLKQLESRSLDT